MVLNSHEICGCLKGEISVFQGEIHNLGNLEVVYGHFATTKTSRPTNSPRQIYQTLSTFALQEQTTLNGGLTGGKSSDGEMTSFTRCQGFNHPQENANYR